ncbi:ligase-associated DNA damage response endonuclease PdeM [Aestuariibius sp. 2305UL40-4]|uniref:ligase-associated DNA damage response endonuclease PdeM n=1 Tax=Aestuariibius violaceus TaxID=3234132 RepID=UPI00345F1037
MNAHVFTLAGADLHALPTGALWWPARRLLVVSDLHLGKSERVARRRGTMLPPYETPATLSRLAADIAATDPAAILCLGDSFDDREAADSLTTDDRNAIATLQQNRTWLWVEGNHDPGPLDGFGGTPLAEHREGPLAFRHIATDATPELSGHYHPKASVRGQSRPAFLYDDTRVVLPAYGAYTGGLACEAPVLQKIMRPGAIAVLTGRRAIPVPMPRSAAA